jgi:hypothetical protein
MSFGPVFVKCDNGKYAQDPVLQTDNYFVCFDDKDPPELVVKESFLQQRLNVTRLTRKLTGQITEEMKKILQEAQIPTGTIADSMRSGYRVFDPDLEGRDKMAPAYQCYFQLTGPLPASKVAEQKFYSKRELEGREGVVVNFVKRA